MKPNIIPSFFLHHFPLLKYRVIGHSMEPAYPPDTVILALCLFIKLQVNDIVILKDPRDQRLLMKRIAKINNARFFVLGDNETQSTDSRQFGWVERKLIVGKVIMTLH